MKPLATGQRVLTWLCLLPPEENTRKWEKLSHVALVIVMIAADIAAFLSSLIYVKKFQSVNMADTSIALTTLIAAIPLTNSTIVTSILRHKIPSIFEKLSDVYEKSTYKFFYLLVFFYIFPKYVLSFLKP